ncbi:MAG: nucleotidyltransferase family protein [Flavobacteriales bacterium]|nr:nucleotidyltransferase family protein [Flavobacteriales bacterium]
MSSREEVIKKLSAYKASVANRYPIASLALFGSFARDEQNDNSDIDVLVEFNGSVGSKFFEMADELEKQLGSKVDLVSRKGIKPKYFSAIKPDLIYV